MSALPQAATPGRDPLAPTVRAPRAIESFPLTPTQHGMLVHALRAPHPGVEIEQIALRLPEVVDVARMRASWAWAVERFEALRISFSWQDDGEPRQRVFDRAAMPLDELDHRGLDDREARDAALARFLEEDRARGLDLAKAPLSRMTLIHRGPRDHVLVWTFHHAILDGRSFTRVLRDTLAHYDAAGIGESGEAPRPPSVRAHCEHLAKRDASGDRDYWAEHLRGFERATELPAMRRTRGDEVGHRELHAWVGAEATQRLRALGDQHGFTLANAVQAAWAITLARHAREADVCFGVTRAGRHGTVPEALEAVGCLIQTTPLRVQVASDRELVAMLRELRASSLAIRAYEHASLVAIREWAGVPSSTTLFESTVVFERYLLDHELRAQGGPWSSRRVSLHQRSAPPIVLAAYQDDDDLLIELEYDLARFDADAIARVHGQVVCLLRAFPDALHAPLGRVPMIDEHESHELLALAGGDAPLLPLEASDVVAAVHARALATPGASAIASDEGEIDYATLDRRVGGLAARLVEVGVGTGDVVAVSARRGAALGTALLGVLRAGAVYLPIDASWPASRTTAILEDAKARALIVDASTRDALTGPWARVDLDAPGALSLPPLEPSPRDGESPATLIYTSGSTGRPKGVLVPHRALLAHARAVIPAFELGASDRCLQFTSPSFDVSIEEMLPTWIAGGCVVPRSDASSRSIDTFLAEIARHQVTVLNLPSAFFNEVVLHLSSHARTLPAHVRLVVVGGERPSRAAYDSFRAMHRTVRFLNAYGPTEVTITSTIADPVKAGVRPDDRCELPIGRPLGTCRAYVLDPSGALAPRGAIGELALAGPQVALGYLDRPELTAARFAPDRFADDGGRLMLTGDLVRWNERGELEILGRADEQLKIRGHRIEPGDIESVLRADPRVRDAVVGARPDASGEARLVAWYLPEGPIDVRALREICEASLPASMIPSAFVAIDALPLGTSGKVDRRALPSPSLERVSIEREPPRGELEEWIARVFRELLGCNEVGAEDGFFELGGHSLLAVRLLSRLSTRGEIELDAIFRAPTVRGLARALAAGPRSAGSSLVPLNQAPATRAPMYLLSGVQVYERIARAMTGDRLVLGGCLPEEADSLLTATPLDVPSMAASYIARIRAHRAHGPYVLGGLSVGGMVAFEVARQLRARGEEVALVVLLDTILPRGLHAASRVARLRAHLDRLRDPRVFVRHLREQMEVRAARRASAPDAHGHVQALALRDEALRLAAERFDPKMKPYEGPAVVFTARDRVLSPGDHVSPDLGWGELLRGPVEYHPIPGEHLSILRDPGVDTIASLLRDRLRDV